MSHPICIANMLRELLTYTSTELKTSNIQITKEN